MTGRRCSRYALALALALAAALPAPALAQAGLLGTVRDSTSGDPIVDARVELRRDGRTVATAYTDAAGRFAFDALAPGAYLLLVQRLDYRPHRLASLTLASNETTVVVIALEPAALTLNPVVVSASRRAEKALDAPASVSVIDRRAVQERPALAPADHVAGVAGIDVATTGITQHEVVARGFSNIASGSLLLLTDNRYASIPSLRINVDNFIPLINEDIERIEIVRGPGAALYGPNSANGVMHLITRSPFASQGTSASLTAGERSLARVSLRHAWLTDGVGLKVSGQYLRGEDWPYTDPYEPQPRDLSVERAAGEAQIAWRAGPRTSMVGALGVNYALSNVELTPLGAAQVNDWRYLYVQSRLTSGSLFAQVFLNSSDAGDTRLLRTGDAISDRSLMAVAQVQYASAVGDRTTLTYGLDIQRTVPRTDRTITGRNEDDDFINEVGGYLHGDVTLTRGVELVTAARIDYHNRLDDPVFSPRAAVVWQAGRTHTLRLTYNRAFSTPNTNHLFLDLEGGTLPTPIPTTVRLTGVPETGFSFERSCGGPCMRSPYTPDSLGGRGAYLATDATLLWDVLVDTLAGRGFDLSGVPAPTAAQAPSRLARLDLSTRTFETVPDVLDIPPLQPTIASTVEVGYRGIFADRVSVGVDLYHAWRKDFITAERVETPSVLFEREPLAAYLANYLPADTAQLLAGFIAMVPVGTVTPREAADPFEVLVTYRNFGEITYWGADLDVGAVVAPGLLLHGTYSWTSADAFAVPLGGGGVDTIPLNAPAGRGSVSLQYRHDGLGLVTEARGRFVRAFPVQSGVYAGTVEAYMVLDATVGYRILQRPALTVTVNALNLLDDRHREFIGAPAIGRLTTVRLRAEF